MPGFDPSTVCLDRIQVTELAGMIYVNLSPLRDRLRPRRLGPVGTPRPEGALPEPEAAFCVFVCHAWNHPDTCLL